MQEPVLVEEHEIDNEDNLIAQDLELHAMDGMLLAYDLKTVAVWLLRNDWTIEGLKAFLDESAEEIEAKV